MPFRVRWQFESRDPRLQPPEPAFWLAFWLAAAVVAFAVAVLVKNLAGAEKDARPEIWIYSASWCGPCQQLHAEIKRKPSKFDKFIVHEIDIDDHPEYGSIDIPQIRWWKADGKTPGGVKGWYPGMFETFYSKWRKDTQK